MHRIGIFILLCFLIATAAAGGTGSFEINTFEKEADRQFIDKSITAFMQKYEIPGLSIAIAKDGEFILAKGYGYADKGKSLPVTPVHQFRIASLSKPVTATAIMTLVEQGRLSLDDKVFGTGGILPVPYPKENKYAGMITVRNLLEHTAAPEWTNDGQDPMFREVNLDKKSLLQWVLETRPLKEPPGTRYAYSNFGYCVLGLVIEKISGQSYRDYVVNTIFKPINAKSFAIADNKPGISPIEVTYYPHTREDPYWFPVKRMDAHGGWIANAMDVVRFVMSVDGRIPPDDVLSPGSIKTMTTPSRLNANYALGWNVNEYNNWWHIGKLPGSAGVLVRTNHGYSWAVLTNKASDAADFENDLDGLTWRVLQGVGQ